MPRMLKITNISPLVTNTYTVLMIDIHFNIQIFTLFIEVTLHGCVISWRTTSNEQTMNNKLRIKRITVTQWHPFCWYLDNDNNVIITKISNVAEFRTDSILLLSREWKTPLAFLWVTMKNCKKRWLFFLTKKRVPLTQLYVYN